MTDRRIPINDLRRQHDEILPEIERKLHEVLASGHLILGPQCEGFEREFASYCGVAHCVGVANGTDAIELGLRALGVHPGAVVATVANAGNYTSTALNAIGAKPCFIDVDPATQLMDADDLERAFSTTRIDVVVVTHLFGLLADVARLKRVARTHGALLFEDCAQAHGAERNNRHAGSFGDAASFSFYPTKNLGAIGDAGAVVTNQSLVNDRARRLRQYGWRTKYQVGEQAGRNSRLDEMQAAVLRVKLKRLAAWNEARREVAATFSDRIRNQAIRLPSAHGKDFVAHLFVVICEERDRLRSYLDAKGIATDIHYPVPDHLQITANPASVRPLPVTESLARSILTLPCFPQLTRDEVGRVVDALNGW